MTPAPLGWLGIVRLGLVQAAIGAVFALTTLTLNRVMVVEYGVPAVIPAGLVAWNYIVQLARPGFGHGSDAGGRRSPYIVGGMGVLALGAILAADAATLISAQPGMGVLLGLFAYTLIGAGVGAAGTGLLALLAVRTAPERRAAAAAITWIMMIAGFILYAAVTGVSLQGFSAQRLALTASGVAGVAFLTAILAVRGAEPAGIADAPQARASRAPFGEVIRAIWRDPLARGFTLFIFVSMLAFSAQELLIEPFAGLVFHLTPAQSAQLSGVEKGGDLLGMIVFGLLGARRRGPRAPWMRRWTAAGCVGSGLGLLGLMAGASMGTSWPLAINLFILGFANGVFAVSAIGSMMGLAGAQESAHAGARMGVWGASQALAFAIGGFVGAGLVEVLRDTLRVAAPAFMAVFALEAGLFLMAGLLAARLTPEASPRAPANLAGALPLGGAS